MIGRTPLLRLAHDIVGRASEQGVRFGFSCAGSGGAAIAALLQTPGASQCLTAAHAPYSRTEVSHLSASSLSSSFVTVGAASDLAQHALRSAERSASSDDPLDLDIAARSHCIGVGCAAAVVSREPRRGHHHCFYALASRSSSRVYYARLEKGQRDRVEEDEQLSMYTLQALASFLGIPVPPEQAPVPLPRAIEDVSVGTEQPWLVAQAEEEGDGLGALLQGTLKPMPKSAGALGVEELPHPRFQAPSEPVAHALLFGTPRASGAMDPVSARYVPHPEWSTLPPCLVVPGSFNPLHRGHVEMALAARRVLGKDLPILFELSVHNVDKASVSLEDTRARIRQFFPALVGGGAGAAVDEHVVHHSDGSASPADRLRCAVAVTHAPLFGEKARLFPGATFIVGADTAKRLVMTRYYRGSSDLMLASLLEIKARGCSFLVAGRETDGRFESLEEVLPSIPDVVKDLFQPIPDFRLDISSTELRRRREEQ